jgi:hypothetical protein
MIKYKINNKIIIKIKLSSKFNNNTIKKKKILN